MKERGEGWGRETGRQGDREERRVSERCIVGELKRGKTFTEKWDREALSAQALASS